MNKLCECGCGKEVINEKNRFVHGSHAARIKLKGVKKTEQAKINMSIAAKSKETQERKKQANLINFGVEYPSQSKEIKEATIQRCLKKHGVKHISQTKEFHEKKIQANRKKYGKDYAFQSEEVKEKIKLSNLKNYNVEYPMQSDEIKNKRKQTHIKHYGVESSNQSEEVKQKKKQSFLNHYGVDSWAKTPQGRESSRINYIKMIENQKLNNEPLGPRIGNTERNCLNTFQLHTLHIIIRNDHLIASLIGFFPDGHIPELKLFIEFDERRHFIDSEYKTYTQKDVDRELVLASLGYIVFRVSEKEWKENKEKVIIQFKTLLNTLTN